VYANAGWHRTAAETCEAVRKFAPNALLARTLIPVLWAQAGERGKAVGICEQQLKENAAAAYTRLLLADLLLLDRKVDEAKAAYAQVARDLPGLLDPRMKLALLAHATGDASGAVAHWQELFRDHPEHLASGNNFVWGLATRATPRLTAPEIAIARSAISAALAVAPKNPAVRDTSGWLHYQLGEDKDAEAELKEAQRLAPYRALPTFHLGMVYARQDKRDFARLLLRQAIALDPDGAFVEQARQMLARLAF
jgi:tetratricopeptide (TPR) repeat protein